MLVVHGINACNHVSQWGITDKASLPLLWPIGEYRVTKLIQQRRRMWVPQRPRHERWDFHEDSSRPRSACCRDQNETAERANLGKAAVLCNQGQHNFVGATVSTGDDLHERQNYFDKSCSLCSPPCPQKHLDRRCMQQAPRLTHKCTQFITFVKECF